VTGLDVRAPGLTSPAVMSQHWIDLAFLHWFVPPAEVAPHLPPGASPDVLAHGRFRGLTPVALVPFKMVGAGLGDGPAVPYLGTFWETNVRLYSVDATGTRGVVFRSLDASRLAVVLGARLALGLPYRFARMRGYERHRNGLRELAWTTRTRWPGPRGVTSRVAIRVGGVIHDFGAAAAPGAAPAPRAPSPPAGTGNDADLAAFLTARWGLHTKAWGRSMYIPNEHDPWTLRSADVLLLDDGLLAAAGFPDLAGRAPDHVCFAEGVRTRFGLPRAVVVGGRHRG
jgi:uncharacterized protein YqjF (DUF2071 family)